MRQTCTYNLICAPLSSHDRCSADIRIQLTPRLVEHVRAEQAAVNNGFVQARGVLPNGSLQGRRYYFEGGAGEATSLHVQ